MLSLMRAAVRRALGPASLEEADLVYGLVGRQPHGVLIEVGAHNGDPTFMRFVRAGWDVHAFEPDRDNRAALEEKVAGHPNVTVLAKAVADKPGRMTLYTSAESTGISSLAAFTSGHAPAEEVEVVALTDYVLDAGVRQVDFLKMDVEGYEKFVMDGYPWRTHRPKAVLLEFEDRKTVALGYEWRDLADELAGRGYSVLVSEWYPIQRYGVVHRWRRFAPYPSELRDGDAWGNLIAVEPDQFSKLRRRAWVAAVRLRIRLRVDRARGLDSRSGGTV